MSSFSVFSRKGVLAAGLAALVALAPAIAEARIGGGSSMGSRGSRTFSAPSATPTAPRPAAPIERSMTPQTAPSPGLARPASPGFFGGGLGRGFLGGLLGAGLFGMLFGHGLMGGFGGIGSIFGLLLQLALVFFIVRFAMNWFANRQQPVTAGASPRTGFGSSPPQGGGGFGFGGFGSGAAPQQPVSSPIQIQDADFAGFERLLSAIQSAYSDENLDRLRTMVTPEMASYFAQEVADNARKGVVNKVSDVKLLQGDLSEAWREGADEYATVAMRFSLIDVMQDRATGRVVSGDAARPDEATEVWTFQRTAGAGVDGWKLSSIQQA